MKKEEKKSIALAKTRRIMPRNSNIGVKPNMGKTGTELTLITINF